MRIFAKFCLFTGGSLMGLGVTGSAIAQGQSQAKQQGNQQANQQAQQNQQGQKNQLGQQNQRAQGKQQGNQGSDAQNGFYGGVSRSPWFSNPTIRQQLQLNDEQFNKLNNAYTQSYTRYNQGLTGLDSKLNESQRAQRLQELHQGFNNEFYKSADGLFGNDTSRQRFNQMDWQYRGYGAFNDPNIQKQLNLTDEQRQRLSRYSDEWNNQMGTWRRDYTTDREGTATRFRDARRESQNRINSVLNPEQRRMWSDMVGKPVDLPEEVYFSNSSNTDTGTSSTNTETKTNPKR